MRRKAVVGRILDTITYMILIAIVFLMAEYTVTVNNQADIDSRSVYRDSAAGEDAIEAPCATFSRGWYNITAVEDGEFECLQPENATFLRFTGSSDKYTWAIINDGGIIRVASASVGDPVPGEGYVLRPFHFSQSYQVIVGNDEKIPMKLEVGGA